MIFFTVTFRRVRFRVDSESRFLVVIVFFFDFVLVGAIIDSDADEEEVDRIDIGSSVSPSSSSPFDMVSCKT